MDDVIRALTETADWLDDPDRPSCERRIGNALRMVGRTLEAIDMERAEEDEPEGLTARTLYVDEDEQGGRQGVSIMTAGGPGYGWPVARLQQRVEHYRQMQARGDRRIPRDGEVILWLAGRIEDES